jgi:hypothetical protein
MSVTTGDFNGDGKSDIAVVNYPGDSINAWLGNGDGSFQSARSTVHDHQLCVGRHRLR